EVKISEGILNSSLVHPREVFKPAITEPSASIILIHNHPSGNPEPSSEDIQITRQMVEAGKIIGIPVHDHIIITAHAHTSFVERGLL
ncbi:MAG TPA: JAB domain-containing protein, partial [Bacteroidota bacterium]|nr:JAB domain-containing protein [Bacteroidota bacterium]